MDVCVLHNTPSPQDITILGEPSTDSRDCTHSCSNDLSMNDLKNCLNEFLNIEDVGISSCGFTPTPEKIVIGNVLRINGYKDQDVRGSKNRLPENGLSKYATFPPLTKHESSISELVDGKEKHGDDITAKVSFPYCYAKSVSGSNSSSIALPTPSKLVSAMKGTHERLGILPKELSVTWSPEVYDPIPHSVSHVLSNKNHRHRSDNKKYGKNKQRGGGKSSRGSKHKEN